MDKSKYWQSQVAGYEASGLSVSGYCRIQGIAPSTFDHWRRKLSGKGSSFVRITPDVTLYEIELKSGARLKVPESKLKRVVELLEVPGAASR